MTSHIPALTVRHLTRQFGSFTAVSDVTETFDVKELNCVIGPNGAGKSTLLNMICGTLKATSGTIQFGETDISGLTGDKIARLGISRKFQVPSVFDSLTVLENLHVSAPKNEDPTVIAGTLEDILLTQDQHVIAADLPHGKKQWLEIGMALVMQPKVLLLDEPTAGLSVDETAATAQLLNALKGQVTIVVIEHDMDFVRALEARTIVMHHGKIIASGAFDDIEKNQLVKDVYLGRA